jgi:hypothetical protein
MPINADHPTKAMVGCRMRRDEPPRNQGLRMKTQNSIRHFLLIACSAFWLAGCSTPATRIKADPEAYNRLTPEQQTLVRAGQIGLGFDFEAVKLALGDPDRVTSRTSADGETVVWHYLSYEASGRILFTGYYHTARGWWGGAAYPYYLDYPDRRVRDRFSVQFRNGRASAITQERSN